MTAWIDELERDLGLSARLRVIQAAGGQRRDIPHPQNAADSALADEIGVPAILWLAKRFAGTKIDFPSTRGSETQRRAACALGFPRWRVSCAKSARCQPPRPNMANARTSS